MKIKLSLVQKILLLSLVIAVSFSGGYLVGFKGFRASISQFPQVTISREVPPDKGTLDFALFWRVWDTVKSKYYDPSKIIPSEMVYGAIRGMVAAIGDPYTVFLPPKENKIVQEDLEGTFEGVGIQLGFKGSRLAVIAPLPGSPAERAGIKAGDFIVGIKDETRNINMGTTGITLPEAVEAIRGKAGTKVTLVLTRDDEEEPKEIEIVRESIDVPSVVINYVGDKSLFAHIKIIKFSGETSDEWDKAVTEIVTKPNVEGIILDVRNNPGGYLDKANYIASDFLESGDVIVKEEGSGNFQNVYKVERLGRLRRERLVVLVNEGSASASEILAGALRDNDRAELVGTKTFGKGTIQEPLSVDGGAGLHITIARWLTPKGTWVNEGGLKPDFEIEDNPNTEVDEQLQKAIEILTK